MPLLDMDGGGSRHHNGMLWLFGDKLEFGRATQKFSGCIVQVAITGEIGITLIQTKGGSDRDGDPVPPPELRRRGSTGDERRWDRSGRDRRGQHLQRQHPAGWARRRRDAALARRGRGR